MADTPLELYEEAYRLHYHEKKIPDAVRIYEAIIRDFPESNECGYAFIQLQKVKANDISKTLKRGGGGYYPLTIVAFLSGLLALIIAIIGTLFLFQQIRLEHERTTLAMIALGKMYSGQEEYALKIIKEMKGASHLDVLVSEFSSDIALKKRSAFKPSRQVPVDTTPKTVSTRSAETPIEREKPKTPPPSRRPPKRTKSPIIYGADSVSYF